MKTKTMYKCSECGAQSPRWAGKCTNCDAWNTYVEIQENKKQFSPQLDNNVSKIVKLGEINAEDNFRIVTGISELDRVLGGGIIPGSIILAGGDPGIGKSTLMLQMCAAIGKYKPLYVTGEESLQQIKFRSTRLKDVSDDMLLVAETSVEQIISHIQNSDCGVVVVDSIQSIYSDRIDATPGSVVQVRECASLLMQLAKKSNKPIFIIGHVTKEGVIAGPKILEHMVDTVLQFEGEKTYSYRILRSVKNRFGSTNEIGIFEMADFGLREVLNPSELFMSGADKNDPGVAVVAAMEGSRPLLLEVQALVSPSNYGVPQRTSNGYDSKRLQMVLAVLEKRLGVQFKQSDVFINIAGGISLSDPSVDMGVAAALVSSLRDVALDSGQVFVGEIGLTGEVRNVSALSQRIGECEKLGFTKVSIPATSEASIKKKYSIDIQSFTRISLVLSDLFA